MIFSNTYRNLSILAILLAAVFCACSSVGGDKLRADECPSRPIRGWNDASSRRRGASSIPSPRPSAKYGLKFRKSSLTSVSPKAACG